MGVLRVLCVFHSYYQGNDKCHGPTKAISGGCTISQNLAKRLLNSLYRFVQPTNLLAATTCGCPIRQTTSRFEFNRGGRTSGLACAVHPTSLRSDRSFP